MSFICIQKTPIYTSCWPREDFTMKPNDEAVNHRANGCTLFLHIFSCSKHYNEKRDWFNRIKSGRVSNRSLFQPLHEEGEGNS